MILTAQEIHHQHTCGHVRIDPFCPKNLNPNSYNYHLSPEILEVTPSLLDSRKKAPHGKIHLPKTGYTLLPGRLYLGSTLEKIGSRDFVITLQGRSSMGRLGLFLQITADLSQLGACHPWTLEMTVVHPLTIYPHMPIGQVSFWKPSGSKAHFYQGKYTHQHGPHHSALFQEMPS